MRSLGGCTVEGLATIASDLKRRPLARVALRFFTYRWKR
jgi:hypothetical protein